MPLAMFTRIFAVVLISALCLPSGAYAADSPAVTQAISGAPEAAAPTAGEKADTVYHNCNVFTMDQSFSKASILAVKGSNLIYVGSDAAEAAKLIGESTKVYDIGGRTVLPGIFDGHMHFMLEGQRLTSVGIGSKSKEEILKIVALEASRLAPGEWIAGGGWNNELWSDKSWPTMEELDAAAPENPVALSRVDGHSTWVNSMALGAAGIDKNTSNPKGGEILKNEQGEVLGILVDTAADAVWDQIPEQSEARKREALLKAQEELFSNGITSIVDAGQTVENVELMKKMYQSGELKLRVYVMLAASSDQDFLYIKEGGKPESGLFDNRLAVRAVKIVSDGSLGSRSAWLLEDYADRPEHRGNGRYSDDELHALIGRARLAGFQVAVHAIGDAAVRQTVDVMERVLKERPLPDHRYRIEHFQITRPEDIARAARDGIIPAMQAVHAASDMGMAEKRVGAELIETSYAWRDVIANGGIIANGSDAPVEPVNPWHGLYAAIARTDLSGNPEGGWRPAQKMSREQALRSFTIWAARAQFAERVTGSLEAGKLADFVVIDRDVAVCPEKEIKDVNVMLTVVGGEHVYLRKP